MKTSSITVEITFTQPLLATASGNAELQAEFIASKAPTKEAADEEVSTVPVSDQIEKASTVFHRDDNGLFLYDYTWRGYLKETIGHMCELGEFKKLSKWTHKRAVDGSIFVKPRRIYLQRGGKNLAEPDDTIQRPLRATTMQGDRVALARSECVSEGTQCQFTVTLLESANTKSAWSELNMDLLRQCLDMGAFKGHGQWRGGGWGVFSWKEIVATNGPAK